MNTFDVGGSMKRGFSVAIAIAAILCCTSGVANAQLTVSFHSPGYTYNRNAFRYDPTPYPLTITVRNTGTVATQPVSVRIAFFAPFSLDSSENSATIRPANPQVLAPGDSLRLTYKMIHPLSLTPFVQRVRFFVKRGATDSTQHNIDVMIPAAEPAELYAALSRDVSLITRTDSLGYEDNPFEVRLRLYNNGGTRADSVVARLLLPSGCVLDPVTQANPIILPQLQPVPIGDVRMDLVWTVRYTSATRAPQQDSIVAIVTGRTIAGGPLQTRHSRNFTADGLAPAFTMSLDAPAALQFDTGTVYSPYPLPLRARITNTGFQDADLRQLRLFITGEGVVSRHDTVRSLHMLRPGETDTLEWELDVLRGRVARDVLFRAEVTDGDAESRGAETRVQVPGRDFGLVLTDIIVPDTVALRPDGTEYVNRSIDVRFKAQNTYWGNVRIVQTRVSPIGVGVFPAGPVLDTPNSFLMPDSVSPEYLATFRITGGASESSVSFDIAVISSLGDTARARRTVRIPALTPRVRLDHEGVDSLRIDSGNLTYTPNPFEQRFTFTNNGSTRIHLDSLAVQIFGDGAVRLGQASFVYDAALEPTQVFSRVWNGQVEKRTTARYVSMAATAFYEGRRTISDTARIFVPGFEPTLRIDIEAPTAVDYDSLTIYRPTQITLVAIARNTGPIAFVLDSVRLFPGEPWGPVPMGAQRVGLVLQPGDSTRLVWPLEFLATLRPDTTNNVTRVTGYFDTTRTVFSEHSIMIPGRPTALRIESIRIPTALTVRSDGRDYNENPLVTSFRVYNDAWVARTLTSTKVELGGGSGLTARTPLERTQTQILSPFSSSMEIVDTFHVDHAQFARQASFRIYATSVLNGNAYAQHMTSIPAITPSGVDLAHAELFRLSAVYPNPASSRQPIQLQIEAATQQMIRLDVYSVLGERVHQCIDIELEQGRSMVPVALSQPGMYLLRISAGSKNITAPLLIVR